MAQGNGYPPGTAEKSLGEIVNEVSEKATLLVREEIELAKAEVTQKVTRIAKGAVLATVGGVFLVFMIIYFLHGLAPSASSSAALRPRRSWPSRRQRRPARCSRRCAADGRVAHACRDPAVAGDHPQ